MAIMQTKGESYRILERDNNGVVVEFVYKCPHCKKRRGSCNLQKRVRTMWVARGFTWILSVTIVAKWQKLDI